MAKFGRSSEAMLKGVHPKLVKVCRAAILVMDFTVVDGVRTPEEQAINKARGVSWTLNSKHLLQEDGYSHAVDLGPYVTGIDWLDTEMFCVLAGVMFAAAYAQGVKIRWGGDWDQDWQGDDERKRDYGHFELVL